MSPPLGQSSDLNSYLVPGQGSNRPSQQHPKKALPTPGRANSPNRLPTLPINQIRQLSQTSQRNIHGCTNYQSSYKPNNKENHRTQRSAREITARTCAANSPKERNDRLLQSERAIMTLSTLRMPPICAETTRTLKEHPISQPSAKATSTKSFLKEGLVHADTARTDAENNLRAKKARNYAANPRRAKSAPARLTRSLSQWPITERESRQLIVQLHINQLEALSLIERCKSLFARFEDTQGQSSVTLNQTEESLLLKTLDKMNKQVSMNGSIKKDIKYFETLISKINSEKAPIFKKLIVKIRRPSARPHLRMIANSTPY